MRSKVATVICLNCVHLPLKSREPSPHSFMFQYPQNPATTVSPSCNSPSFLSLVVLNGPVLFSTAPGCTEPVRFRPQSSVSIRNSHQLLQISPSTNSFALRTLKCYMYTPPTTMSTTNLYRHALEKLAAEPPTTKTALLYSLLSEIEAALGSGKTHKQIWQRLSEAGLDITCETFCRLILRARKKPRISAARGGKSAAVSELRAQQTASCVEHDPLVNLRKLEASRPGFHYRGTENLDVLVYGRKESREHSKR